MHALKKVSYSFSTDASEDVPIYEGKDHTHGQLIYRCGLYHVVASRLEHGGIVSYGCLWLTAVFCIIKGPMHEMKAKPTNKCKNTFEYHCRQASLGDTLLESTTTVPPDTAAMFAVG